jgi:hypothetical protein
MKKPEALFMLRASLYFELCQIVQAVMWHISYSVRRIPHVETVTTLRVCRRNRSSIAYSRQGDESRKLATLIFFALTRFVLKVHFDVESRLIAGLKMYRLGYLCLSDSAMNP